MNKTPIAPTWQSALECLKIAKGGNLFGNSQFSYWVAQKREPYWKSISLFLDDDLLELHRDRYNKRTTYRMAYTRRWNYDDKKKGYGSIENVFEKRIESRKGMKAFFRTFLEKVNEVGCCQYGYFTFK